MVPQVTWGSIVNSDLIRLLTQTDEHQLTILQVALAKRATDKVLKKVLEKAQ